ncbi:MAG: LCP family protein [Deltaproteobacteria bacterium]|nr:LCP family protein [Deltaproteobacteria bacterium]
MARRLLTGLLGLTVLGSGAAWWLTRRPLAYAERTDSPAVGDPRPAPAAAHPTPQPSESDAPAPIALPAQATAPATRTRRGPPPRFARTANYLLVGIDGSRGRALGRADTLILAVFDDASGHVGFVSVPRDLYVEIPDHGPNRINATLRVAAKLRKDPLDLVRDVTATALAVPIQHVVAVDLGVFEEGIDRLGGLTIDVPCPIDDNFIDRRTESGRRPLRVAAGRQRMDGVTVAMYARSRHGRSDWDRARRHQAIIAALHDRAGELGADVWLPIALDSLERGVITSMSRLQMMSLARRVAAIDREKMHGVVIGTRQTEIHWTDERQAVLVPRYDDVDDLMAGLFSAPAPGVRPAGKRCPDADVAIP